MKFAPLSEISFFASRSRVNSLNTFCMHVATGWGVDQAQQFSTEPQVGSAPPPASWCQMRGQFCDVAITITVFLEILKTKGLAVGLMTYTNATQTFDKRRRHALFFKFLSFSLSWAPCISCMYYIVCSRAVSSSSCWLSPCVAPHFVEDLEGDGDDDDDDEEEDDDGDDDDIAARGAKGVLNSSRRAEGAIIQFGVRK